MEFLNTCSFQMYMYTDTKVLTAFFFLQPTLFMLKHNGIQCNNVNKVHVQNVKQFPAQNYILASDLIRFAIFC